MARTIRLTEEVFLHPRQYELLTALIKAGKPLDARTLSSILGKKQEDIMRDVEELGSKGLVQTRRVIKYKVVLTDYGRKYLEEGFPEEKLIRVIQSLGGQAIPIRELSARAKEAGLGREEYSASIGRLKKGGVLLIKGGEVSLNTRLLEELVKELGKYRKVLQELEGGVVFNEPQWWFREFRHRKLISVEEVKEILLEPTPLARRLFREGKIHEAEIVSRLTTDLIESGKWRYVKLKSFDLSIDVPVRQLRKKHPYIRFLDRVREILVGMGFQEMKGPHIELSLWNFDVLFVPQYHPSRRSSDVYFAKVPGKVHVDLNLLKRVKEIHTSVLKYTWSEEEALKPVLRTHTTPVSMRTIVNRGGGEYRAFSLDRVFRPDTPDPTHLMEFHQLEGIIVSKNVTFRDLLSFFKDLADALDLGEVRFRPAYFPFTEPSVEGYIKHPELGWIEVFPGGMFRPEVLRGVGLPDEYQVAAWGIGIDRIAMMVLGISDIRELYTNDLEVIERMPVAKEVIK